jgi:hypothetical protein
MIYIITIVCLVIVCLFSIFINYTIYIKIVAAITRHLKYEHNKNGAEIKKMFK